MSRQYDRSYELTIIPKDGETRTISALRVTFEITKSILSFPNLARITIYNPNKETLASLQKRFTSILLNAGYRGNVKLIFKGQIRNVFQSKEGPDRIITIYAGDGQQDWQNAIFNKTFTESVTISAAIEEVIASFKEITVGALQGLPLEADKLRGQTLSGSSKDVLDQFAEEYGFTWSIQDGEVVIVPFDEPLQGSEAVLISAVTGMINSPIVTEIGADVTTLLNPN